MRWKGVYMRNFEGRMKALEKHVPRVQFDMIPFYGPDDEGIIRGDGDETYTEAEFEKLTGGVYINVPGDDEDREIAGRLLAGDDTLKPYMLVHP